MHVLQGHVGPDHYIGGYQYWDPDVIGADDVVYITEALNSLEQLQDHDHECAEDAEFES